MYYCLVNEYRRERERLELRKEQKKYVIIIMYRNEIIVVIAYR